MKSEPRLGEPVTSAGRRFTALPAVAGAGAARTHTNIPIY